MLHVKTQLLKVGNSFDDITRNFANGAAETLARGISEQVTEVQCPNGHIPQGIITVMAIEGKNPKIQKSSFCCQEMGDNIEMTFQYLVLQ